MVTHIKKRKVIIQIQYMTDKEELEHVLDVLKKYNLPISPILEYAIEEKKAWVRKNLPGIEENHMIFSKEGRDKRDFIPGGFRPTDVLIDDYSANLHAWANTCCGIKLLNGINHTKKTWQGPCISRFVPGKEIANEILSFASL